MVAPFASKLELRSDSKYFFIVSLDGSICIDRRNKMITRPNSPLPNLERIVSIYGVIGVIDLLKGPYLIVITERKLVGVFDSHEIYMISAVNLIPFDETSNLSSQHQEDENRYLSLIKDYVFNNHFYMSYTLDLTNNTQRRSDLTPESAAQPLWKRLDARFWWNLNVMSFFLNSTDSTKSTTVFSPDELTPFIIPIVMGFIGFVDLSIGRQEVQVGIFSRRAASRAGFRYLVRGIDDGSDVANFVETEQTLYLKENHKILSFTQVRGSIPIYWDQKINFKYAPKISVFKKNTQEAFERHFNQLEKYYNSNLIIYLSLIKLTGNESIVGKAYLQEVTKLNKPNLKYIEFDFHKECSNQDYSKLFSLMDKLKEDFTKIGWFEVVSKSNREGDSFFSEIISRQRGVIRTNCIDNLDRTNITQSVIAQILLLNQLKYLSLIEDEINHISQISSLFDLYYNLWADNGDIISIQYAGTGALKSDFTRKGKRTFSGILSDGWKSISRYWFNNTSDGVKQDAFNLFLGIFKIDISNPSPFDIDKGRRQSLQIFILINLCLFFIGIIFFYRGSKKYALGTFFIIYVIISLTIKIRGPTLVNVPILTSKRYSK